MATVKIAPFNRLEGHLDVDATTASDGFSEVVNVCNNKVVMFRGLENIMVRRDPRDAPIITPRT
jgi:Ni,Fe-hydrogenase I large subunit